MLAWSEGAGKATRFSVKRLCEGIYMLRACQQRCQDKLGVDKGQCHRRNVYLRISTSWDLRHPGDSILEETGSGASPGAALTRSRVRLVLRAQGFSGSERVAVREEVNGSAVRKALRGKA